MKISNNSLAVLLVVAIVASVSGTWLSINFMDSITGAATSGSGTANLTVASVTSCSMLDNIVEFGSMARNEWNDSIDVNETVRGDWISIENDGNVNITVLVNSTNDLWTSQSAPTAYWGIFCAYSEDDNATCNGTNVSIPAGTDAPHTIIIGLSPVDDVDNISLGFNVTVPSDELSGDKNGTVLFTCSAT